MSLLRDRLQTVPSTAAFAVVNCAFVAFVAFSTTHCVRRDDEAARSGRIVQPAGLPCVCDCMQKRRSRRLLPHSILARLAQELCEFSALEVGMTVCFV